MVGSGYAHEHLVQARALEVVQVVERLRFGRERENDWQPGSGRLQREERLCNISAVHLGCTSAAPRLYLGCTSARQTSRLSRRDGTSAKILRVGRSRGMAAASSRLATCAGGYGGIWGDMGRHGEIWGDMGRHGETWGQLALEPARGA